MRNPGVVFSTEKIHKILEQLNISGENMISSKEGLTGEVLHLIEGESNVLIRGE